MCHKVLSAAALICALAAPATADPTLGFGLSFTFGGGKINTGVGLRVFSNDEQDKPAITVGLDYMFGTQSWRGSLGAAYMMDNSYIEMNGGYNFDGSGFDFGFGTGAARTTAPAKGQIVGNGPAIGNEPIVITGR